MRGNASARQTGMSLRRVILACFCVTIGALLLFLVATLMPRMSALLEQNAVERTRETVLQSTGSLEIYIDGMIATLHFVGGILPAEPGRDDALYPAQIDLLQSSQRDIRNIAFFDEGGALLYGTSTQAALPPETVRQADWFAGAIARQGAIPYFSQPHVQHLFEGHHEWVVTLAKAVPYMQGGEHRTGVLLMDVDFAAIASVVSGVSLNQSGYLYLMDEHDTILSHPRMQLIYAGLDMEDTAAARAQVVGVCRDVAPDGRERVLMIHTVNQTRWRLVGVAYLDEIFALQGAFLRGMSIALACGALLSFAAATLTAYFVTRPIDTLQRKMRQVEAGDLYTAIDARGFREIRSLSATFNHMLGRIRALMDQIVAEQEAKRLHELNALQAQINPHFLYNTLDSIIWMQERGRSQEAITMVSALAKLFRISISQGRTVITVREELEHVRNYLIIQKMRFRDRFTYAIEAEEQVLDLRTVKLIIQPLVENAVHHAIDAYDERVLHIRIDARLADGALVITVADDGTGIPPDKLHSILSAPPGRTGIGLRNVHERIGLLCGRQWGLCVHSVEDEGTTVTIRLPGDMEVGA